MAAPTVREAVSGASYTSTGSTVTLTLGSGTAVGDLLVLFMGEDFAPTSSTYNMNAPASTYGAWTNTFQVPSSGVTNSDAAISGWQRVVGTAGTQTVVITPTTGNDSGAFGIVYVLSNPAATTPVVGSSVSRTSTASSSQASPSIASGLTDDLLLCCWQNAYFASGNTTPVTIPGSMSSAVTTPTADGAIMRSAREVLTSSGATGTRTATGPTVAGWATGAFLVRGGAGGGGPTGPEPGRFLISA